MSITTPNILTISRAASIPLIILCILSGSNNMKIVACILCSIACITDILDGYIARNFKQMSKFGKVLDPIADKLLISSVLIVLLGNNHISRHCTIPIMIIIIREILISGLREYMNKEKDLMPVTNIGKYKTIGQMVALMFFMVGMITHHILVIIGEYLLWIAAVITIFSAYVYIKNIIQNSKFE